MEARRGCPATKRGTPEAIWQDHFPRIEMLWEPDDCQGAWLSFAEALEENIRLRVVLQEVRSVDAIMEEVAVEFAGEDPLRPVMRNVLDKTRRELTMWHEVLSEAEPLELREPDKDDMALARRYFQNGFELMQRV